MRSEPICFNKKDRDKSVYSSYYFTAKSQSAQRVANV